MMFRGAQRVLAKWLPMHAAGGQFHQRSFLALVVSNGALGWLWLGESVHADRLPPLAGLGLIAAILATGWLVHRLHRRHFRLAVCAFLAVEVLFIAAMAWLLRDPAAPYLFLLVVASGTLLGRAGPLWLAAVTSAVLLALARAMPLTLAPDLAHRQTLLVLLVAGVSTHSGLELFQALESAEVAAREASRHTEEARQRRAELHQALKSLDLAWSQLQRANSELFQAREAADAALRFKSEFAAQISHELRTSLNLVLGFSETMVFSQHSYGEKLPAPYLRDATEIYRSSQHLLALIDDVLDLSKLQAGRMGLHREPADLGPMLREATDIARPLVETKGLELVLDLPPSLPTLLVDRTRLRQVVLNLLSNAVRATKQGRIVVQAAHVGNEVVVQVRDTGIGISQENLAHVFDEFRQVDGAAGAAGLGLAVSRRIVALHGGRMWAESDYGSGSMFALALPLPHAPAYAATIPGQAPAPAAVQPVVVMLGGEESDEVKLLQRHLQGYTILAAPTLEEATRLSVEASARAVILNAAIDEVPELPPSQLPLPLIACSLPGPQQAQRAMGVTCYLQKPISGKALCDALSRAAPAAESVLIVDDSPAAVRLIERIVTAAEKPYRLFRAYSGRGALGRVRAQPPDVIVLDLAMIDGDGSWLISMLRQDPSTARIPVVVTTGRSVEEVWQSGPIGITSSRGFTPTETLSYLQAILSAVPPATRMSARS